MNALRNARALAAGQAAWDNAIPPCEESFLDTTDGQSWLSGAADDLIDDCLYIAGKRVTEQVSELESKLAEHVAGKYAAGEDYDGALGQVIRNVLAGNLDLAHRALLLIISKSDARGMAEELVTPLADDYIESLRDDDHD